MFPSALRFRCFFGFNVEPGPPPGVGVWVEVDWVSDLRGRPRLRFTGCGGAAAAAAAGSPSISSGKKKISEWATDSSQEDGDLGQHYMLKS